MPCRPRADIKLNSSHIAVTLVAVAKYQADLGSLPDLGLRDKWEREQLEEVITLLEAGKRLVEKIEKDENT